MYVNKLDNVIDKTIDGFYSTLKNNSRVRSILGERNFIRYQKEINDILIEFSKNFDNKSLEDLSKRGDTIHIIREFLKRNIALYLFIWIGVETSVQDNLIFMNNVVEFTKNQKEYPLKIDNFFNSESNSNIIQYVHMYQNIIGIIGQDKSTYHTEEAVLRQSYGRETIDMLNALGKEFVEKNFKSGPTQTHNLIRTIIIFQYNRNERTDLIKMLEAAESSNEEFIFIDIVEPLRSNVDISILEGIVTRKDIIRGTIYDLWEFITESDKPDFVPNIDEKIGMLFGTRMMLPITSDFLLYHKDSERYEKPGTHVDMKKKDANRAKFIINRVDTVANLYSEKVSATPMADNAIKQLNVPLINRRATIQNDILNSKIINKFLSQSRRTPEQQDMLMEIIGYKEYPYINFKDFEKNGFSFVVDRTIDCVRDVSLNKTGRFRQNPNDPIQTRVGTEDMTLNITGLVIQDSNPMCYTVNNLQNIRDFESNSFTKTGGSESAVESGGSESAVESGGSDLFIKYIYEKKIRGTSMPPLYWIIDPEKDMILGGEFSGSANSVKEVVGSIYDRLVQETYLEILDQISQTSKTIQEGSRVIEQIQNRILRIPRNSQMAINIEKTLIGSSISNDDPYDYLEDTLYGLHGNILKLPKIQRDLSIPYSLYRIDLSRLTEEGVEEEREKISGICQHNISWENISNLRRSNPKKYAEDLFDFLKQYVIVNSEQEYVCKSCSFYIDIKNQITSGTYDNDTQKFITHSIPMFVALEESEEYVKFKQTIRIIDKLVERIASIANVPHLIGNSTTAKSRRKNVVKDVIDMVVSNNLLLKHRFKARNEEASRLYGVSRNLSSIFIFDLDNSILQFSSRDKDQYRTIKVNNIISYIIIFIVLEISDTQVPFLSSDKKYLCDFPIFDRFGSSLFEDLKLKKNDREGLIDVKDLRIFQYILYMISCKVIKHQIWDYSYEPTTAKKLRQIPNIQKIIIHTVVDIINSIIENSYNKKAGYIFEVFRSRLNDKLPLFGNQRMYKDLREQQVGKTEDRKVTQLQVQTYKLSGQYTPLEFEQAIYQLCKPHRLTFNQKEKLFGKSAFVAYELNNITNCPTGEFHVFWDTDWKPSTFTCKICRIKLQDIKLDPSQTTKIQANYRRLVLKSTIQSLCQTGIGFGVDRKLCQDCENDKCTDKQLDEFEREFKQYKLNWSRDQYNIYQTMRENNKKEMTYIDKIYERTRKNQENNPDFVQNFILNIKNIKGSPIVNNTSLIDNTYIIDHNHMGNKLNKPLIIEDRDKKIQFKDNHSFFKRDVIFYSSYSQGKVMVFYDAIHKNLLGYKEESKDFVRIDRTDKFLKIEYSLQNKLQLLGYTGQYVNMDPEISEMSDNLKIGKDEARNRAVQKIMQIRHQNIKRTIYYLQIVCFRTIRNYKRQIKDDSTIGEDDNDFYFENKMFSLVEKYSNKLQGIRTEDQNGNHSFSKHWKGIYRHTSLEKVSVSIDDTSTLDVMKVNKFDRDGQIYLFFLIDEMTKLLRYNESNFVKHNIIEFLVDFINEMFYQFNKDIVSSDKDIQRFQCVLNSSTFARDIREKAYEGVSGIYDEYQDETVDEEAVAENRDVLREEMDAYDISIEHDEMDAFDPDGDTALDYQSMFDHAVEFDPEFIRDPPYEAYGSLPY